MKYLDTLIKKNLHSFEIFTLILIIIVLLWVWKTYSYYLEYYLYRYVLYSTLSLPYTPNSRNLLLYSNSTMSMESPDELGYGRPSLAKFLKSQHVTEILYITYAWPNIRDGVNTRAADINLKDRLGPSFAKIGIDVKLLNTTASSHEQQEEINKAQAVYMCGGNTFWLTKSLHDNNVIKTLQNRINNGMPFVGASAGTNAVCPTMQTTNDMPNTCIPSCQTLGIIPFQINVHFNDWVEGHGFGGESRKLRICEYLQGNRTFKNGSPTFVLGLREGSLLHVSGDKAEILGMQSRKPILMQIKNGNFTTKDIAVGSRVDNLLNLST